MCLGEPARIIEIDPELPELAYVERAGSRVAVHLGLLEPDSLAVGDWVVVHIGFAVQRMDPAEAEDSREFARHLVETHPDEAMLTWGKEN
jgi:hydrogenase expression/formation protein HypC